MNKSEVTRTPTDDFGDRHTNQLILRSLKTKEKLYYNNKGYNTLLLLKNKGP
jgi:hypothetical protein